MFKTETVLMGVALCLLPMTVMAAPPKAHDKATATSYQCVKCHMKVSAAVAKKDHFKDPMDGGKFVPVKATAKPAGNKPPKGVISL